MLNCMSNTRKRAVRAWVSTESLWEPQLRLLELMLHEYMMKLRLPGACQSSAGAVFSLHVLSWVLTCEHSPKKTEPPNSLYLHSNWVYDTQLLHFMETVIPNLESRNKNNHGFLFRDRRASLFCIHSNPIQIHAALNYHRLPQSHQDPGINR